MDSYRVAVIGAGRLWKSEGATGFGMSHAHMRGYAATGRCELVAVADISRENAEEFARTHGTDAAIYTDYQQMLSAEKPDIVSICTWPHLHAPMTIAAAALPVRAIWCEKPMAPTWSESKAMHDACMESGVNLILNHQRRFLEPFQRVRGLLESGAIGELRRIEGQCDNIYDWGTHWLDMFFFYNAETPAEWVIGQIDSRTERTIFGVPVEDQAIAHVKFRNGVRGTLVTGFEAEIGCANRIIGETGVIEIGWQEPWLRIWAAGDADWRIVPTKEGIHDSIVHERVAADLIHSLDTGERPLLSSHNAIQATEVIFSVYESSRRRARIDLPLDAAGC